ncbi:MAG: hypothetical protein ACFUZC_16520 [Chthoniobacteraceae bacterium]
MEALLAEAGVIAADPEQRVKIKLLGQEMSKIAEAVGLVVGKAPHKLFLRGDVVMKIEYDPNQDDLDFYPMKESEFVTWVERFVSFGKEVSSEDAEGNEKKRWVALSIQQKTAKLILDSPQFRASLPRVGRKNRVQLPRLCRDGRIELLPRGFDAESGVFTFPSEVAIDETWTAKKACDYFLDLLSEFPLPVISVDMPDGSKKIMFDPRGVGACIAGMVSTFVEGLLPSHTLRCGFIYTANAPRSGKSLLGKMAIAPITGQAAGFTLSRDDDSMRKQIDSALLCGQSCLFFDNVKGYLESHVLEALMTLPYWQGRVLGTQRMFTVKNETSIFISGNNATVSADINGRFIYVELFMDTADPSAREHRRELDDRWLVDPKNRSDILSALWALVRHWDAAGRPGAPTHLAGFKAWCDVVGGIVCSVSELSGGAIGNPLAPVELAAAGDKESKHLRKLVEAMLDGSIEENLEFTPAEVTEIAMTNGLFDWFLPELPEGKKVDDVLKQPERVKLGKLLVAKSGEEPRGVRYLVKHWDKTGKEEQQLWRFSFRGSGRSRRYLLTHE